MKKGKIIKQFRVKLFFGLFGVDSKGNLYSPSGRKVVWLPRKIAFSVHRFVNRFADVGML